MNIEVDRPIILAGAFSALEAEGINVEELLAQEIPLEAYREMGEQSKTLAALSILVEAVVRAGCSTSVLGDVVRLIFLAGWNVALPILIDEITAEDL